LPILVLSASLGLTIAFWHREQEVERRAQHEAFDAALNDASQQLQLRMAALEHLLQGVQGFLAATPLHDAAALQRYVEALPLGADFAGLQGVGLARRGGTPDHPTVLLQQIEPATEQNNAAAGRDLWAQPLLRRALLQAEDSGRMALSAKLNLRELHLGAQAGFVLVLPVYSPAPKSDQPPGTVATRRETLQAWVLAPLVAPDLMASLYGSLPQGLALTLYDGQQLEPAAVLYRSANSGSVNARPLQQQAREYLVIGGHTWTLALQSSTDFAARRGLEMPRLLLVVGGCFSLLLALLAGLLGTARERAQALAERMTQALRESEQRWSFALEGAGDGVWDLQPQTGVISSSVRWKTLIGWPPGRDEPTLAELRERIHPEDRSRAQVELQRCLDGVNGNLVSEYRVAAAHNHDANPDSPAGWNWVLARGKVVERDGKQLALRLIGTVSDINARRQSEERMRFMALHDPLTELANRAHFDERMHFALANARRYNESLGLILLDLDRFKPINDQFGHAVGDRLLQTVAQRIKSSVRETDTVGRIGGDEFVVLLTGPVTRETAQVVADKIFNQVALPIELSGVQIEITCSLGLAIHPDDGADELSLTKSADDAMYANKRTGRHVMGDFTSP
jgi:diguanylate cyclase (GGDEF)-like protein